MRTLVDDDSPVLAYTIRSGMGSRRICSVIDGGNYDLKEIPARPLGESQELVQHLRVVIMYTLDPEEEKR